MNKRKNKQINKKNKTIDAITKKLNSNDKKNDNVEKNEKNDFDEKKNTNNNQKNDRNEKSKHITNEKNDFNDIAQSNQMWKKNDSIKSLIDMKNWKFCKKYNWIFKNDDVSSKNTIFDDKLIVKIIELNFFKIEMHKKWNYTFNTKNNLNENIDETKTSTKIEFKKQWYYVLIEKYIMYENENSYIETKRKNSTTKIDDNSTKNLFCFKSQKEKLSKKLHKNKTNFTWNDEQKKIESLFTNNIFQKQKRIFWWQKKIFIE